MNARFEELPQDKRANILNGAMKTFARQGYRKASTGDIAAEAGISKSLLFHYFGAKLQLFSYAFNYSIDLVVDAMKDFDYQANEDLFEMIGRSNRVKLGLFKDHPYLYRFVYQSYFEEEPGVQAVVRQRNAALVTDGYAETLKHMDHSKLMPGLPPEKALQIILWVSEGFLQQKLTTRDMDPDRLLSDFQGWMGVLKTCFYRS